MKPPTLLKISKGVIFTLMLFACPFFGCIALLTLYLPLLYIKPRWARMATDTLVANWFACAVCWYERFYGVNVVISGNVQNLGPEVGVLLVMNHRTRLDWLFILSYQLRYGSLENLKITLKSFLKHIPGPGWAMQAAGFIFLERDWNRDKETLRRGMDYFRDVGFNPHYLLFPEGTDLTTYTKSKSDKYAKENMYTVFDHVLHPRTTGFAYMVQYLRENRAIDYVTDVTIAYPGNVVQNEIGILTGNFPEKIHFHVDSFLIESLPESKEDLDAWCKGRWLEKEQWLRDFYHSERVNRNKYKGKEATDQDGLLMYKGLMMWMSICGLSVILLVALPAFRWYCVVMSLVYLCVGICNGLEYWQAKLVQSSNNNR